MAALGRARPGARLAPLCRGALGVACSFFLEALTPAVAAGASGAWSGRGAGPESSLGGHQ